MTNHAVARFAVGALGLALAATTPAMATTAITAVNADLIGAIRSTSTVPPRASRAMAIVEIAMYDSVNAASGLHYRPYAYSGPAASGVSAEAAAYNAGYSALAGLFPALAANFQTSLNTALGTLNLSAPVLAASAALGNGIAGGLLGARAADGSAGAQIPYTFGTGPGAFQSVAGGAQPLLPGWGAVDPFVIEAGDAFRLAPPPALGSAEFLADYNEVRTLGCATCGTAWQQETARFWADGGGTLTPPGHWLSIAGDIADAKGLSLMETARLGAMVGAAVADAGIAQWDSKYFYNYWRPVTAIADCTMATCGVDGEAGWVPYLATPNFPSYGSGHSAFSGAGAAVLTEFFGTDAVDFCVDADPATGLGQRCYSSFASAAAEAGRSRIYGGIHFEFDDALSVAMGGQIGRYVAGNAFDAVPEPESWTLFVAGFAVMGSTVRRRRAVASA